MDTTKHPDRLIVLTYCIMSFCWAGKNLLTLTDMTICAFSGIIRGVVAVSLKKTKIPDFICRGVAALMAALAIIEIYFATGWVDSDAMTVIGSMIPPLAAGAMLVEGMCTARHLSGKQKIRNAILISISLAAGVYIAVAITKIRGLSI